MKSMTALLAVILLTACFCGAADAPAKIPVILDTDIGTDIDDAFALALIIDSPEFELLGVTTVSGDTAARARIAAKMLWEAGGKWRQVPVVAGVPGPKQDINQAPWANGFAGPQILHESAVDFLRSKFHRYPGQITLIAIGELTNVAAVIKADPLAAKKIKRIALMGGSIARGYAPGSKPDAEWNIISNPAAAQVVFSSGIPIIMAPTIGAQETFNRRWLEEIQAGIPQAEPRYANEWIFELLDQGRFAEASWSGFLKARKYGTYKIHELIATGTMTRQGDPLTR